MNNLLEKATERSIRYIDSLEDRRVFPSSGAIEKLSQFEELLPEEPTDPETVLEMLDDIGSPATVATAGGRYFGFVVGSALPATVAASWPAAAWDQNGGISVSSWATTQADLDRSLEAILRIAAKVTQSQS